MFKVINLINKKNFFFYLIFIYLFLAINSVPYIYSWETIKFNKYYIKIILGYSPILIFIFCIIFLYISRLKLRFNLLTILLLVFSSYSLLQFPSLIFSDKIIFFHGFYWIIASVTLPIYLISINTFHKENGIILMNITLIILFIITALFMFRLMADLLFSPVVSFSFYGSPTLDPNTIFLNSHVPRSSGMSRFSIVFFILFHQISIDSNYNKKILKNISFALAVFFLFCVFHFQSRLSIGFLVIYGIFNLIPLFHRETFKILLKKIFILFFCAFLVHLSFPLVKAKIKFDYLEVDRNDFFIHPKIIPILNIIVKSREDDDEPLNLKESKKKNSYKDGDGDNDIEINKKTEIFKYFKTVSKGRVFTNPNNSGRIDLWKKAIKHIKTSPYIGKGPLADRVYLGENVSNLLVYSLLSGGILSLLLILIFYFCLIGKGFKEVFVNLEFQHKGNFYKKVSLYFVGYFIFRSLTENSFGIFGVDYFLLLLSTNILFKSYE